VASGLVAVKPILIACWVVLGYFTTTFLLLSYYFPTTFLLLYYACL
jgi:hypothetical protein